MAEFGVFPNKYGVAQRNVGANWVGFDGQEAVAHGNWKQLNTLTTGCYEPLSVLTAVAVSSERVTIGIGDQIKEF
jgi:hypothetical protein